MNRRTSSPPVIILLDLLFLLVFILILNQSNQTSIEIPKNTLFKNSILIYYEDGINYLVNQETKEIEDVYQPKVNVGFSYFQRCKSQCKDYKSFNQKNLYIVFPNDLFNQISKITYIASHTDYNCKNLKFKVTLEGKIDYNKLLENSCLEKINGIKTLKNY